MTLRLSPMSGIQLMGTGSARPSDLGAGAVLDNDDVFRAVFGPDAEAELAARGWRSDHPREAWGVSRREWISGGAGVRTADVSHLAARAAEQALEDAGIEPRDVDLFLAATSTPARITSTLASTLGKHFETTSPCIDVRAGGAGGLDAWLSAARFLSDDCPVALVVASETPSVFVDPDDLAGSFLYGDGASALVLRHVPGYDGGLVGAVLAHATAPGRAFTVPGSLPPDDAQVTSARYRWQSPDATYRDALASAWTSLCTGLREAFPDEISGVDHFLPYAVTSGQVTAATSALGTPPERTFETLADDGCLGCAGPLVSLDALRRDGQVEQGQTVALASVAGGVSMAGLIWRL